MPEERAVLRRVRRGDVRPARAGRGRRATAGSTPLKEFIAGGRKAQAGRHGRAAARRATEDELEAFREQYTIPKFEPATLRARARSCAPSSASTAARPRPRRCWSTSDGELLTKAVPALEGQPDPGREGDPGADQGAGSTTRARRSRCWASAPPATPPTCSRSRVRADVNIVETVAHMMAAVQLLRRRRRHLRHRRAGHQGPVHGRTATSRTSACRTSARPATACCCRRWPISSACRSPSTPTPPSAPSWRPSSATAARCSSTATA